MRTAQVIRTWTDWPYQAPSQPLLDFAIKRVVPEIRQSTAEHGAQYTVKGLEYMDAAVIMAWDDQMIVIDEDYGIFVPMHGRMAVGSGEAEALGYLGDEGPWTKSQVVEAARRAALSAYGVGGDLYVTSTKNLVVELVE